ncbi:MAG: radical SAM protein, partial [Ignavibacteriaceae bacterium]
LVKKEAPKLLEQEFRKKNYIPKVIVFSGNTDCYQPLERKLKITRETLKICLKYKNPVGVITKNSLIQRDIDILKEMAQENLVSVTLSITSLDPKLCRVMEPRTASPIKRLETIEMLAKNNIPSGVNIAPIIPGLNDEEIPSILKAAAERGALHAGHVMLRLPFAVKDLFVDWVQKEFPDRSNKIINKIKEMCGGKLNSSEFGKRFSAEGEVVETIHKLFKLSCDKYGLNKIQRHITTENFMRASNSQLELF